MIRHTLNAEGDFRRTICMDGRLSATSAPSTSGSPWCHICLMKKENKLVSLYRPSGIFFSPETPRLIHVHQLEDIMYCDHGVKEIQEVSNISAATHV